MSSIDRPLCVDLDGSLSRVDTLHESLLGLIKQGPSAWWKLPRLLGEGKAAFKAGVTRLAPVRAQTLPFNTELLAWLQDEKQRGRRLVLVTASDQSTADAVANHLQLFDEVMASDGRINLSREAKRDALNARFGAGGYDYVGNSDHDLPIWQDCAEAVVVGPQAMRRQAEAVSRVGRHFAPRQAGLRTWIRAMRVHQWVKNLLIFVSPLLAHNLNEPAILLATCLAFLSFCFCASSVYITNDLLDLESDRRHPSKCRRPFAAGVLPADRGLMLAAGLLGLSLLLGALVNTYFLLALAAYFACTLAYSLYLKRFALIDVMMLAGLYAMRVIAGNCAALIWPSFWLLAFSIFLFLSLGIVKRYTELRDVVLAGKPGAAGRGYYPEDVATLQGLGMAAGYAAVVVMALYVNSTKSGELYDRPEALWLLCPIMLFWISRVWLLAGRGHMHEDPIVFALRDRISWALVVLLGAGMALSI